MKYVMPCVPNVKITNNKGEEFLIDYIYETNMLSLNNDNTLLIIEMPLSDTKIDKLNFLDIYNLALKFDTRTLDSEKIESKEISLSGMKLIRKTQRYTNELKSEENVYIFYNGTDNIDDLINKTLSEQPMKLQVRYIDKNITPMEKIDGGDLVDLRVSRVFKNGEEVTFPCQYKFGDTLFFKLGFAMKMPPNKKSSVYPRSGMFKNYGFILTNSVGQIDNKFQGNDDEWCAMCWCTRDGEINYDDRILQFEVVDRVMENVEFEIVEELGYVNRGGYSSTGVR